MNTCYTNATFAGTEFTECRQTLLITKKHKSFVPTFILLLALLVSGGVWGQTNYYYDGSGDLNSTSNWGTVTDGSGANPSNFTTANQIFNIRNAATATLGANWVVSPSTSKVVVGDGINPVTVTIPSTFSLIGRVDVSSTGTLLINHATLPTFVALDDASTIEFASGSAVTIPAVTGGYGNVVVSGAGTKTVTASITIDGNLLVNSSTLTVGAAANRTITVNGNMTVSSGSTFSVADFSGIRSQVVALKGNLVNNGTITTTAGDDVCNFTFNGPTAQSLGGSIITVFNNLTLSNAAGLTLGVDAEVLKTLTLTTGIISTGINKITVGTTAISSASATDYINGNLRKHVLNAAAPTVALPIGDGSNYTPISITFVGTTSGSGYLDASTSATAPALGALPVGASLNGIKHVKRRWVVTNSGVGGFTTYAPTFTFTASDIQGGANTASFVVRKLDAGAWASTTVSTRTATSTRCTGLTSFSEFAIGEPCTAPTGLTYSSNPAAYCLGTAITNNTPTNSGDAPTSYSISPALPTGLVLNATTGVISGTPTVASAATNYTVTASASCGSTSTMISIATLTPYSFSLSTTVTNIICGTSTGSILVAASGGIAPYSGTGTFAGLVAGPYSYTVTDANGCSAMTSATVLNLPVKNLTGPTYHATIQAAIAAAANGDVIEVCAGTYAETINLNKSLTLRGPNASLVPCVDTRNTEAIITGGINVDNAASKTVVVEGFHFQGVTSPFNYNGNALGTIALAATFRNNLVNMSSGQFAVNLGTATNTANVTVNNNCFQNMSANAMQINGGGSNGALEAQVTGNIINTTVNSGINADGLTNSNISNNAISNTTQQGIQLAGASGTVTIANNVITNANTSLAADRGGIRIRGTLYIGAVNITNNIISGSLNGIAVANGENITGKTILVNDNNLSGNTASVYHGGTGSLNAECNWHGSTNNNTILAQLGGSGVASIDYVPYLTSNADSNVAMGFQPSGTCTGTPVVIASAVATNILCGPTTGSIVVTFSGGTAPFDIAWTGGSATGVTSPYTITPLLAGSYSVTVTDANGSTTSTTSVMVQYLPVKNLTGPTYHATIQAAIAAAVAGDVIEVCSGIYNELVNISKANLTIKGVGAPKPTITWTGATPVDLVKGLVTVNASGATIENFTMNVDLAKLNSAIAANGANANNLTVKSNTINPILSGSYIGSYGRRNAININYRDSRVNNSNPNGILVQGNVVTYNDGGTPGVPADDASFRSALATDEAGLTIDANTFQTPENDIEVRFGGGGNIVVTNNNFNGSGARIGEYNAGAGSINVSNNTFTGAFTNALGKYGLTLFNNWSNKITTVTSNTFTGVDKSISLENYRSVTVHDNSFTPSMGSTNYRHLTVNTKEFSSSSGFYDPNVDLTLTKNKFYGSGTPGGTALGFYNNDNNTAITPGAAPVFGTFTLGSVGNENEFASGIGTFIYLDNNTSTVAPGPTQSACWATNLDIQNNTYDVGAGLQLPQAMNAAQRTALEGKLTHKPDIACLGKLQFYLPVHNLTQNTYFGTIQSAIVAANPSDIIELSEETYNEAVTITKSLTLQGIDIDKTKQVISGTGLGITSGIVIANGITGVTIKNLTVQNFTGTNGNANAGIYGIGGNDNLTITNVAMLNNPTASGFYANGPVNNVSITNSMAVNNGGSARGIVIWNGLKTNITITGNMVTNNSCCGIELSDGNASGVNISGNTIDIGSGDNAIGVVGLNSSVGANTINSNIITGGGRFGIEIKNPAGGVTVNANTVNLSTQNGDLRDRAGIAILRRSLTAGNVDVPNGVTITGNTVTGYQQTSTSEGFGIVVEGTNHTVTGNIVSGCDVGILQQQNPSLYPGDADQSNVADLFFGRGNSPMTCGNTISGNTFSSNGTDTRNIGVGAGLVVNTNTMENFCSIQAAIDDANTDVGHVITVAAGTYAETINLNKSLTLRGPNASLVPCVDTRNTEAIITGGINVDNAASKTVVVEGFHFQGVTSPFNYNGNALGTIALAATFRNNLVNMSSGQFAVNLGTATNTANVTVNNNCFQNMSANAMQINGGGSNGALEAQVTGNIINTTVNSGINADGLTNSNISNNAISNTTQQGIQLAGASGTVTIANNVITNANTSLAADRGGIRIRGTLYIGAVNITNNIISGSLNGIAVANGENITGKTILVNDNNLSGNTASVYHGGTGSLNAECNWHGSTNNNTILAQLGGSGVASIDYVPYLTSNADSNVAMGFQPSGTCTGTPVVIASAVATNILCGPTTGSIVVTFSGGTAPFDIAWTGGSATGVTSPYTITPLLAGSYSVTVTDANGSTTSTTSVMVQYLPVKNLTGPTYHATIQAAIAVAVAGDVIEVCSGIYNELVNISKANLTIKGVGAPKPTITWTGATPVDLVKGLVTVNASGATIENFTMNVDLAKLNSAIAANGANANNLTVKSNTINPILSGSYIGSYGRRNAININYRDSRVNNSNPNGILVQGNVVTYNDGGTPGVPADDASFRSALATDEAGLTIDANTFQTPENDIEVRFGGGGNIVVTNNNFNGSGARIGEYNVGAGSINVSNNTFTGAFTNALGKYGLTLFNNWSNKITTVTSNTFTGVDKSISLENYRSVTVHDNSFTPSMGSTNYRHLTVNTKEFSSSSGFYDPNVDLTLTKNKFYGSGTPGGTALGFYNNDNNTAITPGAAPVFGTFTLGSVGNENEFASGIGTFIYLDNNTSTVAPGPTQSACWATNLDIQNNTYDVGAGLQLPQAMNAAQRTALEGKLTHKPDIACLGKLQFYLPVHNLTQNTYFGTIQSAIVAANPSDIIELSEETYNEAVTITKSLTLQGIDIDKTKQVISGTGLGITSGIVIANGITGVTIKNLTVQNFTGTNGNANAGIYGIGGNDNLTITNVAMLNNPTASGFYANGPVNNVSITNSMAVNNGGSARGIVIWNGLKTNITITGNMVTNNSCCGIELSDGNASGVNISGNTIDIGSGDNAIGVVGLNSSVGANTINSNIITGGGRFGIEIKNPAGGVTVNANTVNLSTQNGDLRDRAGIAILRRSLTAGNVDVPNGVTITGNTITGYQQTSTSEGFGIVVEGTNHTVTGNTVNNCDVGILQQQNPSLYPGDADQNNVADLFFGRGNSPMTCGNLISGNTLSANGLDQRTQPSTITSLSTVINNTTGVTYCSIQAAVTAASAGNVITASAGTYTENVTVNKSLTLRGANFGTAGCGTRNSESVVQGEFILAANGITIDGFGMTGPGARICSSGSLSTESNITIQNNNIYSTTAAQPILHGFGSGGGIGSTGWVIHQNRIADIQATNATAIAVFNISNISITNNCIAHTNASSLGRRGINSDGLQTANISNNTIDMGDGSPTTTTNAPWAIQIGMSDRDATAHILNENTISNTYRAVQTLSQRNLTGLSAHRNVIGPVSLGFDFNTGGVAPVISQPVQSAISIDNSSFVTVTPTISGALGAGVRLRNLHSTNPNGPVSFSNVDINENSFTVPDAAIIIEAGLNATPIVNATCNWYGSNVPATVATKIVGTVTYIPYLINGVDLDGPSNGFQPAAVCTPCALVLATTSTMANCPLNNDGTATVSVTGGGISPYTYLWSNAATTSTISGLIAGTYTVTVTDINGCTTSATVTVVNSPVPTLTSTTVSTVCDGGIATVTLGGLLPSAAHTIQYDINAVPQTAVSATSDGSGIISFPIPLAFVNNGHTLTITTLTVGTCSTTPVSGHTSTLVVNPLPTAYNITGGGTYCAGGMGLPIGLDGSTLGIDYQLFNGVTPIGSPVGGTGSALSFPIQTAIGTYSVVATNTSTLCSANMTGTAAIATENCTISGTINFYQSPASGVGQATVTLSDAGTDTDLTPAAGTYSLDFSATGNYTITPTKNINRTNGLTSADITRIQQHLGGTLILDPGLLIAADVNKSNTISSTDHALINAALLNLPALPFNTSWRFVPNSHTLVNPPWGFPESRTLTSVSTSQTGIDFRGIKIGDVVTTFADPANFGTGNPLIWTVQDQMLQEGQTLDIDFTAQPIIDLASFQFALQYPTDDLEYIGLSTYTALPVNAGNFGLTDINEGKIRSVWSVPAGRRVDMPSPIFRLQVKSKTSGKLLSEILQLDPAVLSPYAYNTALEESSVELQFLAVSGTGDITFSNAGIRLYQNRPNPFTDHTTIGFYLPNAGDARLAIYNASGQLITERNNWYPAGYQEEAFQLGTAIGTGLFYYELTTQDGHISRKMEKMIR